MRPILAIASGAFLVLLELSSPAIASASQTTRFSVADTIAVQRPSASVSKPAVLQDPTGRRAALVLMKGELKSDSVTYSLLLIDLESVTRDFSVAPRSDGQVFQTAVTFRSTSNDPAIEAVRWAADGESLTFIGKQADRPAQVYRLHVATRRVQPLTRADSNVIAYDANQAAVIYSVRVLRGSDWFQATAPRGYVVRGWETLKELTTPASIDREWMPDFETFVLRANAGRPVRVQKAKLPQQTSQLRYWLAPTGRHAIAEWRLSEIPESWAEFVGADGYRLAPRASAEMTRHGFGTQLVLIDCETGVVTSLLRAPTAAALRHSYMSPIVAWAPDGRSAMVGGSYLAPEEGMTASERVKRLSHPALVEVQVPTRRAAAIHYFGPPADMRSSFIAVGNLKRAADGSRVNIDLSTHNVSPDRESLTPPTPVRLTFERAADGWRPVSQPPGTEPASPPETAPVAVEIKEDMNQPPLLIAREHQSGRDTVLLDLNPQLHRFDLPRWEVFEWRSHDGQPWRGGLLLPKVRREGERVPLIIQTHGFSVTRVLVDGPFSTAFAAQPLAANGFAVLQVPDDVTTFASEDLAVASREGAVHLAAYESAIDALAEKGLIDRERVGLVGFSRTVYHVGYALAFARFPLKAVVASDGVDMGYGEYLAWLQGLDPLWPRTFELRNGGNPFDGNIANWVRQVPHFNLQQATAALRTEGLDHTGTLTSWEMHMAMRRLGLPSELVLYAGGKHELFKPSQRYASMQGTVDWMRFWVKDEEDADPTKAEQYARWRVLREQRDALRDTAQ